MEHPTLTEPDDSTRVFAAAAELFGLLSTPIRLRIISAACNEEKTVNELLAEVGGTQSNLSQHLAVLYRAGVLQRRKEGTAVYYQVQSEQVATLCRSVCNRIAVQLDDPQAVPRTERLAPAAQY
jgi:DNA-binding transcriptional ArsR family regulator